ncbi:MAG: DUF3108 domain-containing protein [Betaproteobacteria bacterium]|nr:DUF3108 domain-containing protein [Betaproteobacteria bacterium]
MKLPAKTPWFFTMSIALFCSGTVLAAPPQRVTVEYDMSHNGTAMAQVVETMQHDGKRYVLESEVKGKGLFALARSGSAKRSSVGEVTPSGLRPNEFRDRRGDRPENVARFNWAKGSLSQGEAGRTDAQPMPALEQGASLSDRLSFLWSFAFSPPQGKEVRALLSDGRGLSTFRYAIAGNEVLKTPAGDIDTVKLVKQRDAGDDRGTEIWLASRRGFIPVRILVIEKDGTRIDQMVTRMGS